MNVVEVDDDDVICLDTDNEILTKNSEQENSHQNDSRSNSQSRLNFLFGPEVNSPSNNYFSEEENTIDDESPPNTQNPQSQRIRFGKAAKTVTEEPPKKKMKSKAEGKQTSRKKTKALPPIKLDPKDCIYPRPVGVLLDLVVAILQNTKCLMSNEIWDYISGMFPFYEYCYTPYQGKIEIMKIATEFQTFFLRTSNASKSYNKKLIMLNPVMKQEQILMIEKMKANKGTLIQAMFQPDIFDSFVNGTLMLSSIKVFRLRYRVQPKKTSQDPNPTSPTDTTVPVPSRLRPSAGSSSDEPPPKDSQPPSEDEILILDVEEEATNPSSPRSTSSTDTIVFDPKIINCRSINDKETEEVFMDEEGEILSRASNADPKFQVSSQILSSNLLNQFDTLPLNSNFISNASFANTVWSIEENPPASISQNVSEPGTPMESPNSEKSPKNVVSFPEVEKCIPRWKEIFPWVTWKPWLKKIFCATCQDIHDKVNSGHRSIVVELFHPDDVFKVSKLLRSHSEKSSHKMATVLSNKQTVSTLYFLLSSHFTEFNSISDILECFENLLGKDSIVTQDMLKYTITMLGQFLEDKIISLMKKAKKFSVITDPCSGVLIVRWVNEDNEPEEHIISSYFSVNDKTPTAYLVSLGLETKHMITYVSNTRCDECARCKSTKKVTYKKKTPLRLPQLDRYLVFLWRMKVLKPFYSMGCTLCKLWVSFPHKFSIMSKIISLDKLTKFPSSPDAFLEIILYFDKFKEIVSSIYSLTGNLEALGFQTIDITKYVWILDAFPILTTINILLMEVKVIYPFMKGFDNLFHSVEKLKLFCDKSKEALKAKEIAVDNVDSADIDDFFHLINMTVKEYQLPIYHKGKSVALSFSRMTNIHNLKETKNNITIANTYNILYDTIKSHYRYEKTVCLKSLLAFLQEHKSCEKKSSLFALEYFNKNQELIGRHAAVHGFFKHIAHYAFQPATHERCLYEIKVYDYLFYRSAWAGIGPNIKDYLLTIISELNAKHLLSEKEIQVWWRKKFAKASSETASK